MRLGEARHEAGDPAHLWVGEGEGQEAVTGWETPGLARWVV